MRAAGCVTVLCVVCTCQSVLNEVRLFAQSNDNS